MSATKRAFPGQNCFSRLGVYGGPMGPVPLVLEGCSLRNSDSPQKTQYAINETYLFNPKLFLKVLLLVVVPVMVVVVVLACQIQIPRSARERTFGLWRKMYFSRSGRITGHYVQLLIEKP